MHLLARAVALIVAAVALGCAPLRTPEQLVSWMAAHPENVGYAVFTPGREAEGIYVRADDRFPLASVRKVLTLGAYAERAARGAIDPAERVPIAAVERWYWEGTDGGAHVGAKREWRSKGRIQGEAVAIDDIAWAMIRWSDNAASDWLLDRVGGPPAVDDFAKRMGMAHQDPIWPIFGEFVVWSTMRADDWLSITPAARARSALDAAARTRPEVLDALHLPNRSLAHELASVSVSGTPREWAHLMATVFGAVEGGPASPLAPDAAVIMRRHLEWPLAAFASNRARFKHFGAKGGSLSGVLTDVAYFEPQTPTGPVVSALFFCNLPSEENAELNESFAQQALASRVAREPAFREQVRNALASAPH